MLGEIFFFELIKQKNILSDYKYHITHTNMSIYSQTFKTQNINKETVLVGPQTDLAWFIKRKKSKSEREGMRQPHN